MNFEHKIPPSPLRNCHICMKGAQCADANEKFIFQLLRVLFFEIWSILYSKFTESSEYFDLNNRPKMSFFLFQKMRNLLKGLLFAITNFRFLRFLVLQIWSILYSKFLLNRGLRWLCVSSNVSEPDSETLTVQWYPITRWLGGFNPKRSGARR